MLNEPSSRSFTYEIKRSFRRQHGGKQASVGHQGPFGRTGSRYVSPRLTVSWRSRVVQPPAIVGLSRWWHGREVQIVDPAYAEVRAESFRL
jgi:hypothetical protein